MPRLTLGGHVCAPATGLGPVSLDRVTLHPAGSEANWVTPTQVLFQGCDQTCQLLVYDVELQQTTVADGLGANWLRARDGGWAAWLNGQIRTSEGWLAPFGSYLADVAEGNVWITDNTKQSLQAFTLAGVPVGVLSTGPLGEDATAGMNVRVRDGLLLYQTYTAWHLIRLVDLVELPITPRTEPINYAVPFVLDGEPWLLERSSRLTLRPANITSGYVVTEELCYGADAIFDGATVWVSWSASQGELPNDVRVVAPDLLGLPVDLNAPVHTDFPHTDHADAPHTDHADAPHTDHADSPHTDHADAPHTDHADSPHQDGGPVENTIVGLRGPGGKFGRCDPNEPQTIYWDKDDVGPHEQVELLPREGKPGVYALHFLAADVVVNGASDWIVGGVAQPFNTRPMDQIAGQEEFYVSLQPPDFALITALVYFNDQGVVWTSAPLTLIEQPTS